MLSIWRGGGGGGGGRLKGACNRELPGGLRASPYILNVSRLTWAENASKIGNRMSNDTMNIMGNSSVTLPFISVNNPTCPCIASSRNLTEGLNGGVANTVHG